MFRLLTDFNDIHDGEVSGLLRYVTGPGELRPGMSVLVLDGEGERCRGTVTRVDGELVYVALDLSTWGQAESQRNVTSGLIAVMNLAPAASATAPAEAVTASVDFAAA